MDTVGSFTCTCPASFPSGTGRGASGCLARFTYRGDGTVRDNNASGLEWQQGFSPGTQNQAASITYCTTLALDGDGWRVSAAHGRRTKHYVRPCGRVCGSRDAGIDGGASDLGIDGVELGSVDCLGMSSGTGSLFGAGVHTTTLSVVAGPGGPTSCSAMFTVSR